MNKHTEIVVKFLNYLVSVGVSPNSLKFYRSDIKHFLEFADEEEFSVKTVDNYLKTTSKSASVKTVNRRLSTLRSFSKYLVTRGLLASEFMYEFKNLTSEAEKESLTVEQINTFDRFLIHQKISKNTRHSYLADLKRYLDWKKKNGGEVVKYLNDLRINSSKSIYDRALASLRKYYEYKGKLFPIAKLNIPKGAAYSHFQHKLLSSLETKPGIQKLVHALFYSRPKWYKIYHNYPISSYIHFSVLVLFSVIAGYLIYNRFFALAYPTTPVTPNRFLSFQGRLTNSSGTPITAATDVVFKFYDDDTGGSELWNSGTCSIDPDQDGIFSTLLGSSCGGAIAASVFSENSGVWLGVTVESDSEATPRIQVATVAYALNAETLQGFPLGTGVSTVPYIDSTGKLAIAASSPTIESSSGTFAVTGQAMTISTANTTNGSIAINPDGTGSVDLTFEGTAVGGGKNGFINATNANITGGSLYSGTVASNASGYNFINFLSGSSPTSKFSVSSTGQITTAAGLTIGTTSLSETTSPTDSGAFLVGANDEFDNSDSTNVQAILNDFDTDITTALSASGSLFTDGGDVTYLTATADDFAIGGSTLAASMFGIDESAGNFYFGYDNSASPTLNFEATDGDAGEIAFNTSDTFLFSNARVSVASTLQVGGNTAAGFSRYGTDSTTHSGNISLSNDILIGGDQELEGVLFLDGGLIANSAGTTSISLTSDSINSTNALSGASWLVENTSNVGLAALIVNQTKAGNLFTASVSGSPKVAINATGDLSLGYNGTAIPTTTNPLMVYGHNTTNVASIDTSGNATFAGDLTITGGNITNLITFDNGLTSTGTLTANGTLDANGGVTLGDGGDSVEISGSSLVLDIAGTDELTLTSSALSPSTSDSNALGTTSNMWADLFLASGGVINWNNGDVTITHAANALAFAGVTSDYTFDDTIKPAADDGGALGTTANSWSDLFLADGGVINWNSGGSTITYTSATDQLDFAASDYNFALTDGETLNIDGDGSPTVDILHIGSGDVSATAGVSSLQVDHDSLNASGNAINVTLNGISGNGTDTTVAINVDAFAYTTTAGTNVAQGLNIGTLTETSTVTSTAINLGTGWDTDLNAGTSLEVGIGGTNEITLTSSAFSPSSSDGNALGTSSLMWSDLFLASGSVINWNNGDLSLTHSSDLITLTGGAFTAGGALSVNGATTLGDAIGDTVTVDAGAWTFTNDTDFTLTGGVDGLSFDGSTFSVDATSNRIGINNAAPTVLLEVGTGANVAGTTIATTGLLNSNGNLTRQGGGAADGANYFNLHWTGSAAQLWIDTTNTGTLQFVSDQRIKSNISSLNSQNGLETIMALNPVTFNWTNPTDDPNLQYGFLAQEVRSVLPELVHNTGMVTDRTPDGLLRIDYNGLFAPIVKSIQQLNKNVEKLAEERIRNHSSIISPINGDDVIVDLKPDNSLAASDFIIQGENDSEVAKIDSEGNADFEGTLETEDLAVNKDATIAGTLYADKIDSSRLNQIEKLLSDVESNQNLLAESSNWQPQQASPSADISNIDELAVKSLFVTETAAVNTLFVSQDLTANLINSVDTTLKIQSLALNAIEIMAGRIKIDTSGNTRFEGNVEVAGDLTIQNLVVAKDMGNTTLENEASVDAGIDTNAIAGQSKVASGSAEIKIANTKVDDKSLIYVTPITSTQNKVLFVKSKEEGAFTVGFSENSEAEVEFNWWIIQQN